MLERSRKDRLKQNVSQRISIKIPCLQVEESKERNDVPIHLAEQSRGARGIVRRSIAADLNVRLLQHRLRVLAGLGFKE